MDWQACRGGSWDGGDGGAHGHREHGGRRVPVHDTFFRQLVRRFALANPNFEIVEDTRDGLCSAPRATLFGVVPPNSGG